MIDESRALAYDRSIAGVPARELVAAYGTPLFAVDLDELETEIARMTDAFIARKIVVAYAGKAFLVTAMAELLAASALWLDVCSLGELTTAERGGMPASRMYFTA